MDRQAPKTEKVTNNVPMSSLKVRNSIAFRSQLFLSSFGLYSGGHLSHFTASENINTFKLYITHIRKHAAKDLPVTLPKKNTTSTKVKAKNPAVSLVLLLNSPSAQAMQSKQQIGLPLTKARRVPGRQLSLQTDLGTCIQGIEKKRKKISSDTEILGKGVKTSKISPYFRILTSPQGFHTVLHLKLVTLRPGGIVVTYGLEDYVTCIVHLPVHQCIAGHRITHLVKKHMVTNLGGEMNLF